MTCGGCSKAVDAVLKKTPGVDSVSIDLPAKKVTVEGSATKEEILAAIAKTGKITHRTSHFIQMFNLKQERKHLPSKVVNISQSAGTKRSNTLKLLRTSIVFSENRRHHISLRVVQIQRKQPLLCN